jgi:hypothetical protein
MIQIAKIKKNIFLLLFLFLSKLSYAMLLERRNEDIFSTIPDEIVFTIMNFHLRDVKKSTTPFSNEIDQFKAKGKCCKEEEIFTSLKNLFLVSKKFSSLTKKHTKIYFEQFLPIHQIVIYEVETNKTCSKNIGFRPPLSTSDWDYYSLNKKFFQYMQWLSFCAALIDLLNSYPPKSSYLQKAAKNALKLSTNLFNYEIINFLDRQLKNKRLASISPHLVWIYKNLVDKNLYANQKNQGPYPSDKRWIDIYFEDETKIPKPISIDRSNHVEYNETESAQVKRFVRKYKGFCLKNQNNALDILTSPTEVKKVLNITCAAARVPYLIMRFLIVLHSIPDEKERNRRIVRFLKKLSNYYWYKPLNPSTTKIVRVSA